MHELSLAQNIVEIVRQHVPEDNGRTVRSVKLQLGEMAGVIPDSLMFCFEAIISGTSLEGAILDIEQVPLKAECRSCRRRFAVVENVFACPDCGSSDLAILSGRELQVVEIEVSDGSAEFA